MAHAQFTLDVRTGPVTQKPGEFEILPQKGSEGVVVQVPGKANLVNSIITDPVEAMFEDEDDEELVAKVQKMKGPALREACEEHDLWSVELGSRTTARVPAMKEALIRFLKTGEKGIKTWKQQKIEEYHKAMDAFFQLPDVVAITSTIQDFDHKNKSHADTFMERYRKKHGKGPTRSQNST